MKKRESKLFIDSTNILLIYKYFNESAISYARIIGEYLLTKGYTNTLFVEQLSVFEGITNNSDNIVIFDQSKHALLINLVVVLGGDGTILWANNLFTGYSKPKFLTFNLGTLGYLSYYKCESYREVFHELFSKEEKSISLENRSTLDVEFITKNTELASNKLNCLNDIVFDKGDSIHMIKSQIFINGEYFTTIRSDGLLIATSTGSTAYNLSCTGSIIHSDVDSMILNAISPFSLSFRPIIFTRGVEISIILDQECKMAQAGNDGIKSFELKSSEGIKVKISDEDLTLIVLENIISNPMKNWIQKMIYQLGYNTAFKNS